LIAGNGDPTHFPFSTGDVAGEIVSLGYNLIGNGDGATIADGRRPNWHRRDTDRSVAWAFGRQR